jgi:hypothetical protein
MTKSFLTRNANGIEINELSHVCEHCCVSFISPISFCNDAFSATIAIVFYIVGVLISQGHTINLRITQANGKYNIEVCDHHMAS